MVEKRDDKDVSKSKDEESVQILIPIFIGLIILDFIFSFVRIIYEYNKGITNIISIILTSLIFVLIILIFRRKWYVPFAVGLVYGAIAISSFLYEEYLSAIISIVYISFFLTYKKLGKTFNKP
jgi:hypothetical protein